MVSIHAPRAGCDGFLNLSAERPLKFQFTHPVRGATSEEELEETLGESFNSRTPCGVRRYAGGCFLCRGGSFNSRTPCGVRLKAQLAKNPLEWFQFTHPVRGATAEVGQHVAVAHVSIHAPRAGCDCDLALRLFSLYVSIHAPRAGCDVQLRRAHERITRFNSRTPCGVRPREIRPRSRGLSFNSRTPCGVRPYLGSS